MPRTMERSLWTNEEIPQEISNAVRELRNYPDSLRLANKLYDIGVSIIKEQGLYIPVMPYSAISFYCFGDNEYADSIIRFRRTGILLSGRDEIGVVLTKGKRKSITRVIRKAGMKRMKEYEENLFSLFCHETSLDYLRAIVTKCPVITITSEINKMNQYENTVVTTIRF